MKKLALLALALSGCMVGSPTEPKVEPCVTVLWLSWEQVSTSAWDLVTDSVTYEGDC